MANDALDHAWNRRDAGHAERHLEGMKCRGVEFSRRYPVRMPSMHAMLTEPAIRDRHPRRTTYAVVASVDDVEAERRLAHDARDSVLGIYADLPIRAAAPYCAAAAVGSANDVSALVRPAAFVARGIGGAGVDIAIVDGGVDANVIPVAGGWVPEGSGYVIGSADSTDESDAHGTMCAFDARLGAPDAGILDYALLRAANDTLQVFLSDAIAAYADLIERRETMNPKRPLVVSNSWQVFDRSADAPLGDPGNYSANLNHPVCQQISALLAAGADVVFCAGNCGMPCPVDGCLADATGPGLSILGANAHPDVITAAAVTRDGTRLGYSAQGPGAITARKPDVAGYAHFSANVAYLIHIGTSTACPVVAGLVAALRSIPEGAALSPAALKGVLQQTATNPSHVWTTDLGYGIVNPEAALDLILHAP